VGFNVGLLGLGTVGTGTAEILLNPGQRHSLVNELVIYRVGVRSLDKPRSVAIAPERLTTDLDSIVTDPAVDIVVELIGGLEPARSLILKAIAHKKHVVTANKAVIARYGDEIFSAAETSKVYVLLEAAVGGGIPVIEPLKQSLCANRIQAITGIINGTTNYILTRMKEEGGDFAEILADAQQLGYAEADPTADVDGLDAADKIAILATLAFGGRVKRPEIYCEGIRSITATDIAYAEKLDFTIKLLAIAQRESTDAIGDSENTSDKFQNPEQLQIRVHPTLVPNNHPLANVNQVYNAILIEGDPIGQVMFFGPGAGAGPTASAVVSDILNIAAILTVDRAVPTVDDKPLDPLLACSHHHYCTITPMDEWVTRFYARLIAKDSPGVIGKLGTCFGNHNVSLESVVQTDTQGDRAEVVVVTHHVREGDMRQALDDIRQFDTVTEIASVLRVL
jgi:homoserine dehydrogenase